VQVALQHGAAKPTVWVLGLCPAAWLVWGAMANTLGANPAEALIRSTGDWALRLLCVALAVTPLRVMLALPVLARLRRDLGLLCFTYTCLHLLCYAWLDMGLGLGDIWRDILKRPFILVGMLSWLILLALALTSFNRAVRALGARRWHLLHRTVYAVAGLAVLHFFWMRSGKNDFAEVAVYAAILAALLGWRAWWRLRPRAVPPSVS
jgi:methionine sulfoxide reductase heme-binding subunit